MKFLWCAIGLLVNVSCWAQTKPTCKKPAVVLSATKQSWTGGVVGRRGVNYNIELATMPGATPDTVWLGQTPFAVNVLDPSAKITGGDNASVVKENKRWIYTIRVSEDLSDRREPLHEEEKETDKPATSPNAPIYNGKAYVTLTYKGKKYGAAVKDFMAREPLRYP